MRRRDFIIVVGGAVGWPLATRAQQPDKLPTIAFVGADESSWTPRTSAFVPRLRELGWVEGRSVKISVLLDARASGACSRACGRNPADG